MLEQPSPKDKHINNEMPQVIIEHSKGLEELQLHHDGEPKNTSILQRVCEEIWEQFASHPSVTGPETVRVRCICASASRIYGGPHDSSDRNNQSFAHATLLLLPCRSDETRQELAQIIMDTFQKYLTDCQSLSVRLDDIGQPYLKVIKDGPF